MTLLVYKHIINSVQMSKYFYFLKVNGKNHFYFDEEYVRFYSLAELQKLTRANFKLSCVYGDFNGNLFNEAESNRMISVWKKISQYGWRREKYGSKSGSAQARSKIC